jgi:uncharacterized protein (DUF1499 family)
MGGKRMRWRWLAPTLATVAAVLLLAAGPTVRLGVWDFRTGFQMLRWAAYLGIAAAVVALITLFTPARRGVVGPLLLAVVVGAGVAFVPWRWLQLARRLPSIHDITTDTEQPPEFVAVLRLRVGAPNPATYGGAEIAAAQREGYPDIRPLFLKLSPTAAFHRAQATAERMHWDLVATDSAAGRIEATATTPWFGFKDDVVVRVTPASMGSRVDVRSVSRVGGSDVGANARRIRKFLGEMQEGSKQ